MDIGTFSSSKVDPYEVDGSFLAALRQILIDQVAAVVDPDTLYGETVVGVRAAEHAVIQRKDASGAVLTDGSAASADSVEISVGGIVRGQDGMETMHVSLGLRTDGGDFLYAKGPAREASAAFETMMNGMASRAMPRQIAAQVARKPAFERAFAAARWTIGIAGGVAYAGGLLSMRPVGFAFMMGGLVAALIALTASPRLFRRKADTPASETAKRVNVIDLARRAGGQTPVLEHNPTVPLEL